MFFIKGLVLFIVGPSNYVETFSPDGTCQYLLNGFPGAYAEEFCKNLIDMTFHYFCLIQTIYLTSL